VYLEHDWWRKLKDGAGEDINRRENRRNSSDKKLLWLLEEGTYIVSPKEAQRSKDKSILIVLDETVPG